MDIEPTDDDIAEALRQAGLGTWSPSLMRQAGLGTWSPSLMRTDESMLSRSILAHALTLAKLRHAEELLAAQAAQIAGLQTTMRNIKPYLEWTISDESPGCHPTMPSAVGAFLEALASEPKP